MVRYLLKRLETVGKYFLFLGEICRCMFRRPFRFSLYLSEIERLGINSISIILLSGFAIGMIFALQMNTMLGQFQAELATGAAVGWALTRELGPLVTTLMLIAKSGSAMAAELGTMRVTEQVDAMESMSINVVHYLVVPKVVASVLIFPTLTILAVLVGTWGAYLISTTAFMLDSAVYLDFMFSNLKPWDTYSGLIKAAVMGGMVSSICCFYGLNAEEGGAKGVGDGATKAVVASSVSILLADYVLASFMMKWVYL
ncbi:ABC transporter permease [Treponema sp. OttesenSCG-928-L16]|nr:ABC transporter permease [Treponema sp. OttesenSCG-928-L16]